MKIKEGFVLKKVAGSYMIAPVGDRFVDYSAVITTNETGAYIWELLLTHRTRDELCSALVSKYEGVTSDEISRDVDDFISGLDENNILEHGKGEKSDGYNTNLL